MLVDALNQKGILFKSLSQSLIDTTTETGEFDLNSLLFWQNMNVKDLFVEPRLDKKPHEPEVE